MYLDPKNSMHKFVNGVNCLILNSLVGNPETNVDNFIYQTNLPLSKRYDPS